MESVLSGVDFYNVGDTWVESTSEVTQATAHTKILGGDADVDNYLKATRSNLQDLMQEQIAAKTKGINRAFNDAALYGYVATETKKFDGLHYLLRSLTYNTVTVATSTGTPLALSLAKAEQAIDMVKNGKPSLILMTKQLRRNINKFLNGVGGITKMDIQGKTVQTLNEVPIAVSDHLSDDESCDLDYGSSQFGHDYTDGTALGNDDNSTSIFVLQFAPQAFSGVQSAPLTVVKIGDLETKDAVRVRIKWYPSIMVQSIISCAKVTGIKNDTATV